MFRTLHWAEAVKEAARLDENGAARAHLSCKGKFRKAIATLYYVREVLGHKQFEGYPETMEVYRRLMEKHLVKEDKDEMNTYVQKHLTANEWRGEYRYELMHAAIICVETLLKDIRNFVR